MPRLAALPALLLLATACAPATRPAGAAPGVAAGAEFSADELRRDLFVFASDSFRGRGTGTPNERRAAQFLADGLRAAGVAPAGDSGTYFQRFPLTRQSLGAATRITVTTPSGSTALPLGEQAVPLLTFGPGAPLPKLQAEGDLVFAGYGLETPTRNDYAGLDLTGKVVVVVNGAPAGADSAQREQFESREMIGARLGRILSAQPAAVILLLQGKIGEEFAASAGELLSSVSTDESAPSDAQRVLPLVMLGVPRAGSPLLPAGWPRDDRAQALTGRRLSANIALERERIDGVNVVGVVRGRDAALAETYVAFGAHLDHLGVVAPVGGDSIANGADDDGSGSIALLAVARRFAAAPGRRSVLFVWHGGEEKGLLGSEYFTDHATVPRDSIVAQLNADMIGRNAADSLYIVGPAAAPQGQSRVLGTIVDSVNAAQPRPFAFNREWDSPTHPEQIFFRSDHYSYAKHGVPVVFFTSGLHDDYHKVTDHPEKIDYDKLARVARLMHDVGAAVANRAARPR